MEKFSLDGLDIEEQITREALAGTSPPPGHLLPKEFSQVDANRILVGIEKLRRAILDALSVQKLTGFTSLGRINDIVDAAMSLSGDSAEAYMIYALGDVYLVGAELRERLKKSREVASDNRRAIALQKHLRWKEAAARIWSSNASLPVNTCARMIKYQLHLEEQLKTVADVIRGARPSRNPGNSSNRSGDDC